MTRAPARIAGLLVVVVLVAAGIAFALVQATWRRDFSSTPLPAIVASSDPSVIARGEYVANALAHCGHCHDGTRGAGDLAGGPPMVSPFGRFFPSNLTPDANTGIGRRSDGELARTIRSAVRHDGTLAPGMLVGVGTMADEDLVAVVSYLRSLPPVARATPANEWTFLAKALSSTLSPRSEPVPAYVAPGEVSVARGAYVANGPAACVHCHTDVDPLQGFALAGTPFAGSAFAHEDATDPSYEIVAPNLTPDPATGILAPWSEEQFVARFRLGRVLAGSIMPWESFQRMTEEDLRSVYRYLRTLPPTANAVGPSRRLID